MQKNGSGTDCLGQGNSPLESIETIPNEVTDESYNNDSLPAEGKGNKNPVMMLRVSLDQKSFKNKANFILKELTQKPCLDLPGFSWMKLVLWALR